MDSLNNLHKTYKYLLMLVILACNDCIASGYERDDDYYARSSPYPTPRDDVDGRRESQPGYSAARHAPRGDVGGRRKSPPSYSATDRARYESHMRGARDGRREDTQGFRDDAMGTRPPSYDASRRDPRDFVDGRREDTQGFRGDAMGGRPPSYDARDRTYAERQPMQQQAPPAKKAGLMSKVLNLNPAALAIGGAAVGLAGSIGVDLAKDLGLGKYVKKLAKSKHVRMAALAGSLGLGAAIVPKLLKKKSEAQGQVNGNGEAMAPTQGGRYPAYKAPAHHEPHPSNLLSPMLMGMMMNPTVNPLTNPGLNPLNNPMFALYMSQMFKKNPLKHPMLNPMMASSPVLLQSPQARK